MFPWIDILLDPEETFEILSETEHD